MQEPLYAKNSIPKLSSGFDYYIADGVNYGLL